MSDHTGLTAESYGRSLLAQFAGFEFDCDKFAFVDNAEKALTVAEKIEQANISGGRQAIVFSTLVKPELQAIIDENTGACVINLFNAFLEPIERSLGVSSAHTSGRFADVLGDSGYMRRLDAIDYAMTHDDGIRPDQYDAADVILVGVSRCGKTPTSLFLAINHSIHASNYPLTEDELTGEVLPEVLLAHKSKLVGLTIAPIKLSSIREKRRPGSKYSSANRCNKEVKIAEQMFQYSGIPYFDSTDTSIEELSGLIMGFMNTTDQTPGVCP